MGKLNIPLRIYHNFLHQKALPISGRAFPYDIKFLSERFIRNGIGRLQRTLVGFVSQ